MHHRLVAAGLLVGIPGVVVAGVEKPRAAGPLSEASSLVVYAELLGKGGPWGVGVEGWISRRIGVGAVASVAVLRQQQLYTFAPYVHVTLARGRHNGVFGELGAVLVHSRVPSPVPSWNGTSDTGGGGIATVGWEWMGRIVVVRAYLAIEVGEGGVAPWTGFVLGVQL